MRGLLSIVTGVLGIILFIYLLPTLLWLLFIIIAIIICVFMYFSHKIKKRQREFEKQFNEFDNGQGNAYYYEKTGNFDQRSESFQNNYKEHRAEDVEIINVEFEESEDFPDQNRFRG